jgi:hypothetical protein
MYRTHPACVFFGAYICRVCWNSGNLGNHHHQFTMSTTSTITPRGKPAQRSLTRKASSSIRRTQLDAASDQAALEAVLRTMTANLAPAPAVNALDTLEPVDPASRKIQVSTRMPSATHVPKTFKMDVRLVKLIDLVSREQNLAGLVSHLLVRGLMDVVREMDAAGVAAYHLSYESTDRSAFCGVKDEDLLAMVRYVEGSLAK